MGRGLSEHQKQILGFASLACQLSGRTPGSGSAEDGARFGLEGLMVVGCLDTFDVTHAHCVKHVWNTPTVDTLWMEPIFYSRKDAVYPMNEFFRHGYHARNAGVFSSKIKGTNSAKVAASKALKRLCERDLLRGAINCSGYIGGYVITSAGNEIGCNHRPVAIESEIKKYLMTYRREFLSLMAKWCEASPSGLAHG